MVSGFIASVQGHIIADKFLVLTKVRHSQRVNDSLISRLVITEREGTILFAHCLGDEAGLAESWGQFNKTFTSVICKCSYCFQTLKQWLHL